MKRLTIAEWRDGHYWARRHYRWYRWLSYWCCGDAVAACNQLRRDLVDGAR